MRIRATVALAAAAIAATLIAPAAHAAAYPATVCPSLSVSTTHPLPGEQIAVSGSDFLPAASVRLELRSRVYVLRTVTTDGTGAFSTTVRLPDGVTGAHDIVAATGAPTSATCPGDPIVAIHIQKRGTEGSSVAPTGHGTAFTGVDLVLILLAAAVLIGVGAVFTRGGKSKQRSHPLID